MKTRNWYAWINFMPPKPDCFYVTGEVLVNSPGILAQLHMRKPQGFNPKILFLDLHLIQQQGNWPQVLTWVQTRYEKILPPKHQAYTNLEVFYQGKIIKKMKVDKVN